MKTRMLALAAAACAAALLCACEAVVDESGAPAVVSAAVHSPCMSDGDCAGSDACDTSACVSCCEPGVPCIAVCCGSCVDSNPANRPCASVLCAPGYEPVTDAHGCDHGCRPTHDATACGPTTCAPGQVCCNESCGICTDPDGVCTMQICEPVPAS